MPSRSSTVAELETIMLSLPPDAYVLPTANGNLVVSRTRRLQENDILGYIDLKSRPPRWVPEPQREGEA